MFEKSELRSVLGEYRKKQFALNALLGAFEGNGYDYAIVGGFVRRVLTGDWRCFNDFDIVVDIPPEWIKHIIKHFGLSYSENSNNGFNVKDDNNMSVDVWSLREHGPFVTNYPQLEKSFRNIQEASVISIDGGTYMPAKNKLYWKYLKKSIKRNEIFCLKDPSDYIGKSKIAARLIYLGGTTCFRLSKDVRSFCEACKKIRSLNFKVNRYLKHMLEKRGCSSTG